MPIIQVIVVLVIVGVLLWLAHKYIPMQPAVAKLLDIAVIVILVLWLLGILFPGLWAGLQGLRLPAHR